MQKGSFFFFNLFPGSKENKEKLIPGPAFSVEQSEAWLREGLMSLDSSGYLNKLSYGKSSRTAKEQALLWNPNSPRAIFEKLISPFPKTSLLQVPSTGAGVSNLCPFKL